MRIGVDVGGTFTDLVWDDGGGLDRLKSPSVPNDPATSVMDALAELAERLGQQLRTILQATEVLAVGTTVATNAMLERRGAKVGLLATHGFRDSLALRRGRRRNIWDLDELTPPALVPRYLRATVRGRIRSDGHELAPVALDDIDTAVALFNQHQVEAVAVALFNSYANPNHEIQVAAAVQAALPQAFVCRSTELSGAVGEYERTSTAVVNAYLGPRIAPELTELETRLAREGLPTRLWIMQSSGGLVGVDALRRRPVLSVLSGPAAGVPAAQMWLAELGLPDALLLDMGGTSADITMVSDDGTRLSSLVEIDGYHAAIPSVELHTIGTGGGTIATIDLGGLLRVGPTSSGSRPGPACYGRGGTEATITDANVVLGRLGATTFMGGEMPLDVGAATIAVSRAVAEPLGLDVTAAAKAIIDLADEQMANALQLHARQRGVDLRATTVIAAGGAGGLHACAIARIAGARRVYLPAAGAVACAFGMLASDIRADAVQTIHAPVEQLAAPEVRTVVDDTVARARAAVEDGGIDPAAVDVVVELDLAYPGQKGVISLAVTLVDGVAIDPFDLRQRFEMAHDKRYGFHDQPGATILCTEVHAAATSGAAALNLKEANRPQGAGAITERQIVDEHGELRTHAVVQRTALAPGTVVAGPVVIEDPFTTLLVPAGANVEATASGGCLVLLKDRS